MKVEASETNPLLQVDLGICSGKGLRKKRDGPGFVPRVHPTDAAQIAENSKS
jgi:hypothetical protein